MTHRPARRALVACALVALVALVGAACSSITPSPPGGGREQLPGPAYLHVTADPAIAQRSLTISYVLPDGAVPKQADAVDANTAIDINRTFQPGVHQLQVGGVRCAGPFELKEWMIVEVVVHLADVACETTIAGIRDPSA